jgi:replicative superfamily II helicase
MSEADQLRLQTAATAMISELESSVLYPLQKKSYLCSAGCFDKIVSSESLQHCVQSCQQAPQYASQVVQNEVNDFQQRIQRAMMVCQDKGQDIYKSSNDEGKARSTMEKCGVGVVDEHIKMLKTVDKTIRAGLKKNGI